MKPSQKKALIMNIEIGIIVVGVLVAGYWIFGGWTGGKSSPSVTSAEQTIVAGTDLARTITNLSDLNSAVLASVGIFNMQTFRELKDFSLEIPKEAVGRDNPFAPTDWKIKLGK